MRVRKILLVVASIIKSFIILFLFITNPKADENNIKYYSEDSGILSLMYHRFNENKYPSTNINIDIFKKHLELIQTNKFQFFNPNLMKFDDLGSNFKFFVQI